MHTTIITCISSALALLLPVQVYCWNALGHRLVAQIAYHHLTRQAKEVYNGYNHALDKIYKPQNFANAATWLDGLRSANQPWLDAMHYINLPFSADGTKLIAPGKINAVSAIEKAKVILRNKEQNAFAKGFHLRILLHVVGDVHQPLHSVNHLSKRFPAGDKGGNLFRLKANPVANNLHTYWDKGGGWLTRSRFYSQGELNKKAYAIEKHWPCHLEQMNLNPADWAKESQQIAIQHAYQLKFGTKPSRAYQQQTRLLSEQRIAIAGCRLAALLNTLY